MRVTLVFILILNIASCTKNDSASNIHYHNSKQQAVDAVINSKILDFISDKKVQNSFLNKLAFYDGRIRSIDYSPLIGVLSEKELRQFLDEFKEFMEMTYGDYFCDDIRDVDGWGYNSPRTCIRKPNNYCFP